MRIEILEEAELDLIEGFHFYENQEAGLGLYLGTNLYADIESLKTYEPYQWRRLIRTCTSLSGN